MSQAHAIKGFLQNLLGDANEEEVMVAATKITAVRFDWQRDSKPLAGQPLTQEQCASLIESSQATFSWCIFNSIFTLGICASAAIIANKVRAIRALDRDRVTPYSSSASLPYDEASALVKGKGGRV